MESKIAVIGLGYVGLPVAVHFGYESEVIGFDISPVRVDELKSGKDRNLEVSEDELKKSNILFSSNLDDLKKANFYIVTVPTPVTDENIPDLTLLKSATETVARSLSKGDIVVYESTVYPGATEEDCVPILEEISGLKYNIDFKVGYSPERINPGDKEHNLTKIVKVVSGSDNESLEIIANTYARVVKAGVFKAKSIKVAEAAKVIENSQRDINIAFMNELSIIFDKLGIETNDVLDAAKTKWNFLNFYPGLVGGHCIGVDPYYLTHKAESLGYHPEIILSGRKINDSMGRYVAEKLVKKLIKKGHNISNVIVTLLGITFKENTPDVRNSKLVSVVKELKSYGVQVQIHDPMAYEDETMKYYNVKLTDFDKLKPANATILGVQHDCFNELTASKVRETLIDDSSVVLNIRSRISKEDFDDIGIDSWFL